MHQSGIKAGCFWRARRHERRCYGLRRQASAAQRALRKLVTKSANLLARLLASMKDDDGRVTIEGWYSDVEPLGEAERRAIAEAPQYDEELKKQLGLKRTEGGGRSLLELINQPSLNINGFASGDVGDLARNIIPTKATAVLDLRLVKGNDHQRQTERLVAHIRKQGYYVVR